MEKVICKEDYSSGYRKYYKNKSYKYVEVYLFWMVYDINGDFTYFTDKDFKKYFYYYKSETEHRKLKLDKINNINL